MINCEFLECFLYVNKALGAPVRSYDAGDVTASSSTTTSELRYERVFRRRSGTHNGSCFKHFVPVPFRFSWIPFASLNSKNESSSDLPLRYPAVATRALLPF